MLATPTDSNVAVRFFGDFSLVIGRHPVMRWRAGKARSLFQYLLMNRGKVVSREKLHEILWPGTEWCPGSSSLKVAVHALRQILAAASDAEGHRHIDITYRDFGYLLTAGDVRLDVDEFERACEAGRGAEQRGDIDVALTEYRRATGLHSGEFLAGENADWIDEQRQWLRAMAMRALTFQRDHALGHGDDALVIGLCRRILELDPYQEETYQKLMLMHGRLGELHQVRQWHARCVRVLREELDAVPMLETDQLLRRAMRGQLNRRPARALSA